MVPGSFLQYDIHHQDHDALPRRVENPKGYWFDGRQLLWFEYQQNRTSASRPALTYSPYISGVITSKWWIKPWKQLTGANWFLSHQQGPGQPSGLLSCCNTESTVLYKIPGGVKRWGSLSDIRFVLPGGSAAASLLQTRGRRERQAQKLPSATQSSTVLSPGWGTDGTSTAGFLLQTPMLASGSSVLL